MRRTLAFAFAVSCFGSLLACTAILGNYTVGDTSADGGGKDGGGDVVPGDGSGNDGGPDGSGPQPMTCDPNGNPSTIATDTTLQQDRIWVHALPGNGQRRYRVVAQRGQQEVIAYTLDDKLNLVGGALSVNAFIPNFNIRGVSSYDGGFVILAIVDKGGGPRLDAIRFDDNLDTPDTAVTLISTLAAEVNQDSQFALSPIDDANNHDFFLAFTYKLGANGWQLDTHRVSIIANAPLPTEPTTTVLAARPGGFSMLVAKGAGLAAVLMTGDQGKGDLQVFLTDLNGKLTAGPTVMKPANGGGSFLPLLGISATGPDDLNAFATIQGDITNLNVPLGIRTGSVSGTQLIGSKGDPNVLAPLVPLSVDQIAVDKGTALWQFYPVQGPQYTSAARATNTGKGVNLNWFDAAGHPRALRGGPNALFTGETVSSAAAALDGPPSPLASNLIMAWFNSNSEVRVARIGCLGK